MKQPAIYTMADLVSLTGVKRRTILSWVEKGLVPPSPVRGAGPFFWGEDHLRAIRLVLEVKEQQVTLAELAERLNYRNQEQVRR